MKHYTAEEVSIHRTVDDCWLSIFDNVYDITQLIADNRGPLADPLINQAGFSISHWFDPKTKELKTHIDDIRNLKVPYTPEGRFIHVPPSDPIEWDTLSVPLPWWEDEQYIVGNVSYISEIDIYIYI